MRTMIRLPGLIAFFAVIGLYAAITLVFLDYWIKLLAEKSLGRTNGAEVNIARVEHSFSPLGVRMFDIQFTDPQFPTKNKVSADSLSANIQMAPLLLRKVIVDDLTVQGIAFSTPRQSAGEVYQPIEFSKVLSEPLFADGQGIPSVDDILAKSPLKTTQAIEKVQATYQKHSKKLKVQYAALPSKEKMADYQAQIKALTDTNYQDPAQLIAAKQAFDQLKQQIKAEQQKLRNFKQAAQQAKAELAPQLAQLTAAPGQDYQQLQSLIAGDAQAIENVTRLVFGDKIGQWSQYALAALDLLGPMLQKQTQQEQNLAAEQGRWIAFDDSSSLPDFWIKQAQISLRWQQENIVSHWQNITHQHDLIGQATTFIINSSSSALWQSLKLKGDLWLGESGITAQQDWQLNGLKLAQVNLIQQDKLTGILNQGLLSSTGKVEVVQQQISGTSNIDLSNLKIAATGQNQLTKVLAQTLNNLQQLNIQTDITGILGQVDLSLSSDLNSQLGQALLSNLTPEQQSKLDQLKQKLNAKSQGVLGEQNGQLAQWTQWQELANGDLTRVNNMLEAKLNDVIEQEKEKLKNKLLNKLFN